MKVRNMESPRTGRPVANQFVISDDHRMIFQSYDSMIVDIDFFNSTITFGKDWNYSTTTSKYRNEFLDMYFPSLADTKKLKMLEQIVRACGGETEYQIGAFIYTIKFE
jgi:hypothetical protein